MKKESVLFQGISGAYSEAALLEYIKIKGLPLEPKSQRGFFKELFEGIKNDTELGWLPIENSIHGNVVQSIDLLQEYCFEIIGSHTSKVNHCLCAVSGSTMKSIQTVYSHPQALGQCSKFLFNNSYKQENYEDTAAAAEFVAEGQNIEQAVICSARAAKIYGLDILEENIQDVSENETRFLLVKTKKKEISYQALLEEGRTEVVTTAVFETRNIPAALYKALGGFATNAINVIRIESRPSSSNETDYFFYIDFEGHPDDPLVQNAIEELKYFSKKVTILGSY